VNPFVRVILLVVLLANAQPVRPEAPQAPPAKAPVNQYGLAVVKSARLYAAQAARDERFYLVDLASFIPGLKLDLTYATSKNPTGRRLYPTARAYLRLPVAEALRLVQADLAKRGLGLQIWDGYRPYSATLALWAAVHNSDFVAPPSSGSIHNRGAAVDLTLVDLKTGRELLMPTPYDSFGPATYPTYTNLPAAAIAHRELLRRAMERHGFTRLSTEWWHFEYRGSHDYPVMDVAFTALAGVRLPLNVMVRFPLFRCLARH
jgi:zinc D-Ala-D-Ala dipeptidase